MTDKCLHSYMPILEKRFGLYYGKCFTCGWLGPIAGTAYEAGQLFWQKAKKEFQLVENPILGTHAKYTVNEVEAPRNTTKSAALVNQTYQQLMESIVIQNQATQKPYWIIVSDEGHAAIPHKHFAKAEAEKEAQRLTESKPGITFTVFEAKSSVFTPKADTEKTEYVVPPIYWCGGSFWTHDNRRYL